MAEGKWGKPKSTPISNLAAARKKIEEAMSKYPVFPRDAWYRTAPEPGRVHVVGAGRLSRREQVWLTYLGRECLFALANEPYAPWLNLDICRMSRWGDAVAYRYYLDLTPRHWYLWLACLDTPTVAKAARRPEQWVNLIEDAVAGDDAKQHLLAAWRGIAASFGPPP